MNSEGNEAMGKFVQDFPLLFNVVQFFTYILICIVSGIYLIFAGGLVWSSS